MGDTIGRLYSRRLSLGGNQYPDVESVESDPNGILDRRGGSFAALRGGAGVGPPTALYLCLGGTVWVTLWTSTGGFGAPGQSPVTGIQGNPVTTAAPAIGDTFIWDGAQYILAPGGGGGGGSTYFGPRYVVGNVPNGDSAVPFSAGGFVYVPDPGDGSGIAIACAAAGGAPGDIHVRAGTYDLNQPGSPGVQFQVPGVVLSGAGTATVILGNNSAPAETTVFEVGGGGTLRDLIIQTTLDTGNGGGTGIVEASGGSPVYIENVSVEYNRDPTATSNIRGAFYGNFTPVTCVNCRVVLNGTRAPANPDEALSGFVSRGAVMTLTDCTTNGGDAGIVSNGSLLATRVAANGCTVTNIGLYGAVAYAVGGSAALAVGGGSSIATATANAIGVLFLSFGGTATGSVQGTTVSLDSNVGAGTFGVQVNAGTQVRITGSDITAETGVDSSAGSNDIIVGNVITGQPGTQLVTAGSDEAAHNILL